MKGKIMKTETPTQYSRTNVNIRIQNKCGVNKENLEWKEDYITLFSEARLEKVWVENEDEQFMNKYSNGKHHRVKPAEM